jgi:hypothetical protein
VIPTYFGLMLYGARLQKISAMSGIKQQPKKKSNYIAPVEDAA